MQNVFGEAVLIHWEDFGNATAARLLHLYRGRGPTINDDIQGTAAVTLAAILGACKDEKLSCFKDQSFVILGAGEAGLGIASLIVQALDAEVCHCCSLVSCLSLAMHWTAWVKQW
jgi:malic enzyme